MQYVIGDIKARKRLCQALTGLCLKTCKKYTVLFFILIFSFFFVNSTLSAGALYFPEQNGQTLTVRASVPLAPEFIYSIQKNSSLKLAKAAFALGDEINVQVKIAGGNDFSLRGHQINLQVVNNKKKVLLVFSGETGNDGIAYFSFFADERLLGTHTLRVVDITYGEPIVISREGAFIVSKPADGQKGRELTEQKIIISESITSEQIPSGEVSKIFARANIAQNSGTIIADHETELVRKWGNDP